MKLEQINPFARLGKDTYGTIIPLLGILVAAAASEAYAYAIAQNPMIVGVYVPFLFLILILYFSFRDGVRGGLAATVGTIIYFAYIIYDRDMVESELVSGLWQTGAWFLGYGTLAVVVGSLKQMIDSLLKKEMGERLRLQSILDQLPVGILISDASGKITQGNLMYKRILGKKPRIGKKLTALSKEESDDVISPVERVLYQALKSREPVLEEEYRWQRPSGKEVDISIHSSLIRNKERVVAGAALIQDISDKKLMERRRDDFINTAAHELRTPLTSIQLYVDTLERMIAQDNHEVPLDILKKVRYQVDNLRGLVQVLLDSSRLELGDLELEQSTFSLDNLVREVVELFRVQSDHEFELDLEPTTVKADRFRIYQVMVNLLSNAVKYSDEGSAVSVQVGQQGEDVTVRVLDNGVGIDSGELKRIFEKMYQIGGERKRIYPGLGMGLYVVKEVVEKHGGSVRVRSIVGEGSQFTFTLPVEAGKRRIVS